MRTKCLLISVATLVICGEIVINNQVEATENQGFISKATLTVAPGTLSLSPIEKKLDFGAITLSDKNQEITKSGGIIVSDYTDTHAGWQVSVAKRNIYWDNHLSLALDQPDNRLNSSFKLFRMQSQGHYPLAKVENYQAYLSVPSNAAPGNYTSKIIWSLVQGPENN